MKIIPFKAYRPAANADKIACLPYDVIDSDEAREMAKGNEISFLHVDKPEIDLPRELDIHDDKVYAKGGENLDKLISSGVLKQEDKPCFYIYRQTMDGREQYGLVAGASVEDYDAGLIKKHEFTRKDKELDRTRHIETLGATTGPVFLAYKHNEAMLEVIKKVTAAAPAYDFTADDGIGHTVWVLDCEEGIKKVEDIFSAMPALYVADGHHRSAAASNTAARAKQNGTFKESMNYFLAVIFPAEQLFIMDYNRVVKDLNGLSEADFIKKVEEKFTVEKTSDKKPSAKHSFGMFLGGRWYKLTAKQGTFDENDPIKSLDVSIMQDNLLGPILGIQDPRTDKRIDFIGGIRGTAELEKRVNNGYAVAFSMFATSMADLMKVADAGEVMPPKSTWFEPKLRSGLLIYKY